MRRDAGGGPRPVDLVMFDLDGTLVETAGEICDAVNDTLGDAGLPPVALAALRDWIGHGTRALLVRALAEVTATPVDAVQQRPDLPALIARFDAHYTRHCGTTSTLYPHVASVLPALHARGVGLAVVTNKEARFTERVLAAHGLDRLMAQVISGDTLPRKKPDPEGILHCLRHRATTPQRALFIGDSCIDVAAARAAGVEVWVLPYGYNLGQDIAQAGADRVIASVDALAGLHP